MLINTMSFSTEAIVGPESRILSGAEKRQWLSYSDEKRHIFLDQTRQSNRSPAQHSQRGEGKQDGCNVWKWQDWSFTNPEKHFLYIA